MQKPRSVAQTRGLRKGTRDLLQSIIAVVAAGGGYAVIDLIVGNVNPAVGVILAFVFKILVTYAQNYLETAGKIPTILPTPGQVVTAPVDAVVNTGVGTVAAVVDEAGQVVGDVVDTSGEVVGAVTGSITDAVDDALDVEGVVGDLLGEEDRKTE